MISNIHAGETTEKTSTIADSKFSASILSGQPSPRPCYGGSSHQERLPTLAVRGMDAV